MRTIKFRAYFEHSGLMEPFDFSSVYDEGFRDGEIMAEDGTVYIRPDVKIMQFTGLLDRHGVEIYEGDIIKYITQYYGNKVEHQKVVEWIDDMQDDSFGEPLSMGYRFHGGDIEVIGNIYDNPELLGDEETDSNNT